MSAQQKNVANQTAAQRTPWRYAIEAIVCEPRLVLSAQPIIDIAPHVFIEHDSWIEPIFHTPTLPTVDHGSHNVCQYSPQPLWSSQPIEMQSQPEHLLTGWNEVRNSYGLTGSGQTVAVIDSGIAWDHQALGGGFGSGYRVVGGWDFAENDAVPYDDAPAGFHGTHVAGIIGSDDSRYTGVAEGVDLVSLRVFSDIGQGQMSWVEQALQWVHQNKDSFENPITTVNLSLGSTWNASTIPSWATLEDELAQLEQAGIVVVASAGNSFQNYNQPGLSYPAASPYVIPVASIDDNGLVSDFSQRNDRVIAAPGRTIMSSVPDHVLGTDGVVNDFTNASGTSMAAPYVSGAAALVREAYELIGQTQVGMSQIYATLQNTADSILDSVTGLTIDKLNIANAIASILPVDNVGDTVSSAHAIDLSSADQINSWLNTLGDKDVYRFQSPVGGTLRIDALTEIDGLTFEKWRDGTSLGTSQSDQIEIQIEANRSYAFSVSSREAIGRMSFDLDWNPSTNGGGEGSGSSGPARSIGVVDFASHATTAGEVIEFTAMRSGLGSVVFQGDVQSGSLNVSSNNQSVGVDTTYEQGSLRIDANFVEGQTYRISLPQTSGDLSVVNVLSQSAASLQVHGTSTADQIEVDLQSGLRLSFNGIDYQLPNNSVATLAIDGGGHNDVLQVFGSANAEKVEMQVALSRISNQAIEMTIVDLEKIEFTGNGGPDRAYLYDTAANDILHSNPVTTQLIGSGFDFSVTGVDRAYVFATNGGEDHAYLSDSSGNDTLSIRPQFSSISGEGYSSYVAGFERVYAYGTAGGTDRATLYDSNGNDRFNTSGEVASIVGGDFFSYTRGFESVTAISNAGGHDIATIYASGSTQIASRVDGVEYDNGQNYRFAQGFRGVEKYVNNILQSLNVVETLAEGESSKGEFRPASSADSVPQHAPILVGGFSSDLPSTTQPASSEVHSAPLAFSSGEVETQRLQEESSLQRIDTNSVRAQESQVAQDWTIASKDSLDEADSLEQDLMRTMEQLLSTEREAAISALLFDRFA